MKIVFYFFPWVVYGIFPVQFSIPEEKVVAEIPVKGKDFATLIPGRPETYIYNTEEEYYKGYQESYFAVTCKKGGWDCLRHYEILASGCIPYFLDLDQCDSKTMPFLPKELIWEAMHLEGVSYLQIDHEKFPLQRYYEILDQLLAHTKNYLTTGNMAQYILQTVGYSGIGKILYLSCDLAPDYLRCLNLIGLKQILEDKIVDVPKIEHIYKTYLNKEQLYGKGFTYSQILEDLPIDRENIEERIQNKEFELIIYGSVHRGLLYHDLICQTYEPENVIYICGEDFHVCEYRTLLHSSPFFLREFTGQ